MVGKWADAEDDIGAESPTGKSQKTRLKSAPDATGTITITEYIEKSGVNYKVTKKVRETEVTSRVSVKALERKTFTKFINFEKCEHPEQLRQIGEDVRIEPRKAVKVDEGAALGDEKKSVWTKFRAKQEEDKDGSALDAVKEEGAADTRFGGLGGGGGGKYIPPSLRGASLEDLRAQEQRDRDALTLRVTNLSEDVREGDLSDLFGQFGRIMRIFLAKNPETKLSKGFAFITYQSKKDAEEAIRRLNGHGYDNLVLKVEWAKPNPPAEGGKGGPPQGKDNFPALGRR